MKAAISLPDELFEEIEACARRMRLTRSALIALAIRRFVASQQRHPDPTKAWNDAIAAAGQPGDDRAAITMQRRSKATVRGERRSSLRRSVGQ
jgi:predicted transcriptional regulator